MQRFHFKAGLSTDLDGGVLFDSDFQDPREEGEAEEPWGVVVGALKAAPAAEAKGAVHSVEAVPPGVGDAVCRARAAQVRGAPAEAAPAKAAPAGAAQQERHEQERHEREPYQLEAQRYTKKQHQRAVRHMYAVYMCPRTPKSDEPRRMPSHSRSFHAKATEINV